MTHLIQSTSDIPYTPISNPECLLFLSKEIEREKSNSYTYLMPLCAMCLCFRNEMALARRE